MSILKPLILKFVPSHTPGESRRVPWAVNPPRSLRLERSQPWDEYKSKRSILGRNHNDTTQALNVFSSINFRYRMFSLNSQKQYELRIAEQLSSDPKLFHSYIKHRRVGREAVGPIRLDSGQLTDNPSMMAETFVQSFSSVFSRVSPSSCYPHQTYPLDIDDIVITADMVEEVFKALDAGSAMGSDGLHPRLLRSLAPDLCFPFSIIFNTSLSTGILPPEWSSSIVIPVFKKNSRYL